MRLTPEDLLLRPHVVSGREGDRAAGRERRCIRRHAVLDERGNQAGDPTIDEARDIGARGSIDGQRTELPEVQPMRGGPRATDGQQAQPFGRGVEPEQGTARARGEQMAAHAGWLTVAQRNGEDVDPSGAHEPDGRTARRAAARVGAERLGRSRACDQPARAGLLPVAICVRGGVQRHAGRLIPWRSIARKARSSGTASRACRAPRFALIEDDDLVAVADGAQPVGDDQAGAPRRRRLSSISCSVRGSSALVASSSTSRRGLPTRARAISRRWRWPPLKFAPPRRCG